MCYNRISERGWYNMTVIFCLDENKGMLFNNRRVSRDVMVFEDIKTYLIGSLLINSFSEKLVAASNINFDFFKDFVTKYDSDSYYYIENISVKENLDKIDRIIIYWWNRKYPSDFGLDFDPADYGFKSISTFDFVGKSHEKITREIFER